MARSLSWIPVTWMLLPFIESRNNLAPDGCERDWVHHDDYCYMAVHAHVHFDSAKAVCAIKEAELVSIWNQPEMDFILQQIRKLQVKDVQTWIGTSVARINLKRKWVWLDGSGFLDFIENEETVLPPVDEDICGYISTDRIVKFVTCDVMLPTFVCKKPIQKLYIPDVMNVTDEVIYLAKNPDETIFERLWPPLLEEISMASTYHLATVDVVHETDCAYKCYTIDECKAFIVTCKSSQKCGIRYCSLLTGIEKI